MEATYLQESTEWVRKPKKTDANLKDYFKAYKTFKWKDAEKEFDWHKTRKVNIVHEAVDRHAAGARKNKVALHYWDPTPTEIYPKGRDEKYTFLDLKRESSRFGNVLKKLKIKKGDRVAVFMPRTPELYIAMLGIHRVGAIPVPLFEAFMEAAIEDRLSDSQAQAIITTPALLGRVPLAKLPYLKEVVISADESAATEKFVQEQKKLVHKSIHHYQPLVREASSELEPTWLTVNDGLVIHYTSGSTGKSKGVLHRQYAMVGHYQTSKWVLDLKGDDIYWCTADPGWVTGTSYGIYGPWTLGASSLVIGGRFSAELWYRAIEKFQVSVWYSAPTAFRFLMAQGEAVAKKSDLSSLRHICSVGEPLNPEALRWIRKITGIAPHETWWMTETGMHIICNYPSLDFKIGATGRPFPGTYATVVDDKGKEVKPDTLGNLVVRVPWPSMMKEIWKNPKKFNEYFKLKGWYLSGDSAYKDKDGFIWFAGRADDVIKTSGSAWVLLKWKARSSSTRR